MAIVIPDGYFEAVVEWDIESTMGSTPTNVIGFAADPDLNPSFFEDFKTNLSTQLVRAVSSDWTLRTLTYRIGTAGGPPYPSFELTVDEAGAFVGQACTPNVASLLQKRSFAPGRSGRGRLYLPPGPDDEVNGAGQWSTAMQAALQDTIDGLNAATTDVVGLTSWAILHDEESPLAETPTLGVFWTYSNSVATQRRRMRR